VSSMLDCHTHPPTFFSETQGTYRRLVKDTVSGSGQAVVSNLCGAARTRATVWEGGHNAAVDVEVGWSEAVGTTHHLASDLSRGVSCREHVDGGIVASPLSFQAGVATELGGGRCSGRTTQRCRGAVCRADKASVSRRAWHSQYILPGSVLPPGCKETSTGPAKLHQNHHIVVAQAW
jgi:hypothetical protein